MSETFRSPVVPEDRLSVVLPAIQRFACEEGSALRIATMDMVNNGRPRAYLLPIIDFATRTSLEICKLPSTQEALPEELELRGRIAAHEAGMLAVKGMDPGHPYLLAPLEKDPVMRSGLDIQVVWECLNDKKYLASHCGNPFDETAFLGAGAFLALEERGLADQATSAIAGSKNLLLFAGVPKGRQQGIIDYLGGFPYSDPKHFVVNTDGQVPQVEFADAAREKIIKLLGPEYGCPAAKIAFGGGEVTMLRQKWKNIVRYLFKGQPTVTLNQ